MLLLTGTPPTVMTTMMLGATSEAAPAVLVGCGVTTPVRGWCPLCGCGGRSRRACWPIALTMMTGVNLVGA